MRLVQNCVQPRCGARAVDKLSQIDRSENMRRIRSTNTKPELLVRRMVFALGRRFRLHGTDLPGRPDLVLAKDRTVIFVHGCFWHQHGAKRCVIVLRPRSNLTYWAEKFARNVNRDRRNAKSLRKARWRVITVWECETRNSARLERRLRKLLVESDD
jgi:DNA mismatch endonuclease (patch repair protein)